jgi:poly-gamma-glutamate synthesis protein (capsule biosynthesis protein)
VQTANSYAVYNGMDGLQLTLQGIHSAGMTPLGTFADTAEFQESGGFFIRQIQGIRVAFVAFTKGMDGMGLPAGNEDCVNLLYKDFSSTYQDVDKDGITSLLNAVDRYKPDVTIALLHWGSEYNDQTSKTQDTIVKIMKDAGVDAIIGTHPHYVQKVTYNAETGMLVAYSLGDLLGDATRPGSDYSVILDLEITKSGATGEVKITGFDYTPIYIVNDTANGGSIRVMRIREAMDAYEADSIGAVSKETYEAMKSALKRIESRISGK